MKASSLVHSLWNLHQILQRVTFQQRRHIGMDARLQVLQRDKTPIRQPETVAIETGLALSEDRLHFGANAERRLQRRRNVRKHHLGVTLHANCGARIAGGGETDRTARKPRRYIDLALTGGTRSIHLQRVVAHDRLLRFTSPPVAIERLNVLILLWFQRLTSHWGIIEGEAFHTTIKFPCATVVQAPFYRSLRCKLWRRTLKTIAFCLNVGPPYPGWPPVRRPSHRPAATARRTTRPESASPPALPASDSTQSRPSPSDGARTRERRAGGAKRSAGTGRAACQPRE